MKIHALLCWFDESPSWLAACVASCARFADHVVAVDGAYALFPGARAKSSIDQAEAILAASYGAGVGCTIVQPQTVWSGNEVEKRTAMFAAASALAEPFEDWFVVVDADLVCTDVSPVLHRELRNTDALVAAYAAWWDNDVQSSETQAVFARNVLDNPAKGETSVRCIYRALPNLRCERAHYVICGDTEDGDKVYLWGQEKLHQPYAAALDLTDSLRFEHRHAYRDLARRSAATGYYATRDQLCAEALYDVYVEGLDGQPQLVRRPT